ncbi:N-acetylglucosaminyltransferase [Fulvivirga imtechensis AK7]|uniref:N-acetylglucosaminyltransferase n=1 Tax=Fulvivirga imtechensis AK7 TaxID=1237149 RepID=L8JKX3_9BACT|nr:glycosyltransferase [Fulvivirga imtechensis]ELR69581.1 N-acetylglucosaminyltransferase [Fulvivirga imtechensis AK7]
MTAILTIILTIYCAFVLALICGWLSLPSIPQKGSEIKLFYSVVIPLRNEAENVFVLCQSLLQLDFPKHRYEIILIDDHSEDATGGRVKDFIEQHGFGINIDLLSLRDGVGKKSAILQGINASKGDVIITTDADCIFSPQWLRSISGYYEQQEAEMVFGGVTFHGENTFFKKLQTIEFASLIGTGAASLALGIPNMCNGANFSFRKRAFFTVGGYSDNEHLASGDDEFLMHKFSRQFPGQVFFNTSKDGTVATKPQTTWKDFFQQRKRWASKWRHYSNLKASFLAVFILMFNLAFIMAVGLVIFDAGFYLPLLISIMFKCIVEGIFLSLILKFLKKRLSVSLFIFLQFTYPFYVIICGIAANFGKYTWKGRKN